MTDTVSQPTAAPTRKVTFAAIAAVVINVAAAIVEAAASTHLPTWLVAASTAVATVGAAYFTREAA